MVSEMVTVAVAHETRAPLAHETPAQQPITLALSLDGMVRCELLDHEPAPSLEHALGGDLGLKLIDHLATGWGIGRSAEGMRVWFETRAG